MQWPSTLTPLIVRAGMECKNASSMRVGGSRQAVQFPPDDFYGLRRRAEPAIPGYFRPVMDSEANDEFSPIHVVAEKYGLPNARLQFMLLHNDMSSAVNLAQNS